MVSRVPNVTVATDIASDMNVQAETSVNGGTDDAKATTAAAAAAADAGTQDAAAKSPATVYDFTVKDLDGNDVSLDKYRSVAFTSTGPMSRSPIVMIVVVAVRGHTGDRCC